MRRFVLVASVLAAAAAVLAPATAEAQRTASTYVNLLANGEGQMTAFDSGGETWTWEVCDPSGATCSPFATGQSVTTDGAPTNVLFRATASTGVMGTTELWLGRAKQVGSPSVSGAVRANELVTAVSGGWTGGWQGDRSRFQLAACRTADGSGCLSITDRNYFGCGPGAAVLDPVLTGRYLRVANARYSTGLPQPAILVVAQSPYGMPIWLAEPTVAVSHVGQIAAATGPRRVSCGPPPLEDGSISKDGVATVSCLLGCRAVLSARRGKRGARVALPVAATVSASKKKRKEGQTIPKYPPSFDLELSPKALEKLGSGRARLVLRIDGERVAGRPVKLRAPGRVND